MTDQSDLFDDRWPEVARPEKNRRRLGDRDLNWDKDFEEALLGTLKSGQGRLVSLALLHSSPAKGRLWSRGYRVLHRVCKDNREYAVAWVELKKAEAS